MIDDYESAMALIEEMKAHLPIQVYPGKQFLQLMREKNVRLKSNRLLKIDDVLYGGDDGGILCSLGIIDDETTAYVCSLTHLKINSRHPLAKAIKAYQQTRKQRLAQQHWRGNR